MSNSPKKVLVYGATGSQSAGVVWALLEQGHVPYVLTRNPEKAEQMRAAGAQVVAGDMADADLLRRASEGMDGVSLMVPAFLDNPMEGPRYFRQAVDAAKAAGVPLIVYNTSGSIPAFRTGMPMFDMRIDLVDYLKSSGIPHIVIAPTGYAENLLGPWTRPGIVEKDELAYPNPEQTPVGWIVSADVGKLMAAALQRPELADTVIPVSGQENLTGPELADRFSRALGRTIRYRAMPLDEFGAFFDRLFGPGAGEGAKIGYRMQQENPELVKMWTDMGPVLEKLPVRMTPIEEWVRQFAPAFSAMPVK
jgi:uncharacterized protein YbjT (DUF2867 family)